MLDIEIPQFPINNLGNSFNLRRETDWFLKVLKFEVIPTYLQGKVARGVLCLKILPPKNCQRFSHFFYKLYSNYSLVTIFKGTVCGRSLVFCFKIQRTPISVRILRWTMNLYCLQATLSGQAEFQYCLDGLSKSHEDQKTTAGTAWVTGECSYTSWCGRGFGLSWLGVIMIMILLVPLTFHQVSSR